MYYQQGDVIMERVRKIPLEAKEVTRKDGVLVEGEVTGHAHRIADIWANLIEMRENDGILYVKAKKPVDIVHEEHKTVTLPKGIYRIRRVKEYDHFLEEARKVQD